MSIGLVTSPPRALVVAALILLAESAAYGQERLVHRPFRRAFAVLVGIESYEETTGFRDLQYAHEDVRDLSEVLVEKYGFETPAILLDEEASRERILGTIAETSRVVGADDVLLFYFSGHGFQRSEERQCSNQSGTFTMPVMRAYLAPYVPLGQEDEATSLDSPKSAETESSGSSGPLNEEPSTPNLDGLVPHAIDVEDLRDYLLTRIRAKHVVVILDSCFSGLATRTKGQGMAPHRDSSALLEYLLLRNPSRWVMTAGGVGQTVLEHTNTSLSFAMKNLGDPRMPPVRNSVFTRELVDILREHAGSQMPVTIRALQASLRERVLDVSGSMDATVFIVPQLRAGPHPDARDDAFDVGESQFVFVPQPEDQWLRKVENALGERKSAVVLRKKMLEEASTLRTTAEESRMAQELRDEMLLANILLLTSDFNRGDRRYVRDPRWAVRFERYSKRASSGDDNAMALLYYFYAFGLGTEPDGREAKRWASESAQSQNANGYLALCSALALGVGTPKQESASRELRQGLSQEDLAITGAAVFLAGAEKKHPQATLTGAALLFAAAAQQSSSRQHVTLEQRIDNLKASYARLTSTFAEDRQRGLTEQGRNEVGIALARWKSDAIDAIESVRGKLDQRPKTYEVRSLDSVMQRLQSRRIPAADEALRRAYRRRDTTAIDEAITQLREAMARIAVGIARIRY